MIYNQINFTHIVMQIHRQIYKFIENISGVKLDNSIPIGYLLRLVVTKATDRLYGMLRLLTFKSVYISPHTIIKGRKCLKFGKNLLIVKGCYIDALGVNGLCLGNRVSIGINTTVIVSGSLKQLGKGITIGNNVGLGSHGFYGGAGGVEIGDDTIFGNYVSVHPENHNYRDLNTPIRLQGVNHKGIKIGRGCWIGAKATILDGADIGDGCIVAAGAVVRGKFPPNSIIGGVPAKIIKTRDQNTPS